MEGKTQQTAAAMAGMSERSARKWQHGPLPSETKTGHRWRTRPDPFEGVWEEEIRPLLQGEAAGGLRATTIIDWLEEKFPGRFSASQLRTLQRRLQDWRALNGPDQEVYFPQEHPPGREAQLDFTHCNSLGVTVGGRPYRHRLFQLVLSHSGVALCEVATGETFLALKQGLQNALWELGGAPRVIRSTHLGRHPRDESQSRQGPERRLRRAPGPLWARVHPDQSGESHENGVAEQAHHRLKDAIDQALMLRGSRDFSSLEEYGAFVRKVVDRRKPAGDGEAGGRAPTSFVPCPQLRCRSTSTTGPGCASGAPSRQWAGPTPCPPGSSARRCRYGCTPGTWKVLQGPPGGTDGTRKGGAGGPGRLPPRHRLPSAQARGLRPLPVPGADVSHHDFRLAYDALPGMAWERADVEYVRILHLAATTMECTVDSALALLLEAGEPFDYSTVRDLARPTPLQAPVLSLPGTPDLRVYDSCWRGWCRYPGSLDSGIHDH